MKLSERLRSLLQRLEPRCDDVTIAQWEVDELTAEAQTLEALSEQERFIKPKDNQYCEIAILFNDGLVDQQQLTKMIAMSEFIVDRLHHSGDVSKPSPRELEAEQH